MKGPYFNLKKVFWSYIIYSIGIMFIFSYVTILFFSKNII